MIEAIRIYNKDRSEVWELKNLGKINVLCGKNNSGKTTILEALNMSGSRAVGKVLTKSDYDLFYKETNPHMGWNNGRRSRSIQMEQCNILYEDILKNMLKRRGDTSWYLDDETLFVKTLFQEYSKIPLLNQQPIPAGLLKRAFTRLFPSALSTVLIPAKRSFSTIVNNHSSKGLFPDGSNAVEELFTLKGQLNLEPYERIRNQFYNISSGYKVNVSLARGDNKLRLHFSFEDEPATQADNWGLGLQYLLIMLIHAFQEGSDLVLIEEPENHIHADMQRKLLIFLKEQSQKQFIISTHSSVFLNTLFADKIFHIQFDKAIRIQNATSKAEILNDLGYSVADNLTSDLIILTEGPYDRAPLDILLHKMGLLSSYNIKHWALGGDIMEQQDLTVFAESYNLFALIDKDPGSKVSRKRFVKKCDKAGIPVHRLQRYSLENYFPLRAYKEVFGSQIPDMVTEIKPDEKVSDQIKLNPKKRLKNVADATDLSDIKGTDLDKALRKMQKILEQGGQ